MGEWAGKQEVWKRETNRDGRGQSRERKGGENHGNKLRKISRIESKKGIKRGKLEEKKV